ncbi:hypothetical protein [Ancylomarina longa]|uniref:Uncharacterized protein n=1 Tax=Ancylomarina longa TaxID=2487017 RepID=A0A434AV36_9BACT|nr:hypothetical protein [Ancylomarina longa]RUT78337.1 hypothetical protein DLK05_08400 [Ancylomarina longa]
MKQAEIFSQALNLPKSWLIDTIEFQDVNQAQKALHIQIKYQTSHYFRSLDGEKYPIYDCIEMIQRHFSFLNYTCYLHWSLPRYVDASEHLIQANPPFEKNHLT